MPEITRGPESLNDIELQANELMAKRRRESAEMIEQGKSVREMLDYFDNDYTVLEELYRSKTGGELLANSYESAENEVEVTKTCSIVIPAYNNSERLSNCLRSIQACSFNAKYPSQLEVVIIDDGSPNEDIAKNVEEMAFHDLNLKVARQSNGKCSKGMYSGVLLARGDVVIITAPDVVYTPTVIEEYMKRQQVLAGAVMFGMRGSIEANDERLGEESVKNGSLDDLPLNLDQDDRVKDEGLADSRWLKDGGNNKPLPIDVENNIFSWNLASVAWGLSFCADRKDMVKTMSGYDPRYTGYGRDDEDMTARLIALGNFIIPNTAGMCFHQEHPSAGSVENRQINDQVFYENMNSTLKVQDVNNPSPTDAEVKYSQVSSRTEPSSLETKPHTSREKGMLELAMGNYQHALEYFQSCESADRDSYWNRFDMAKCKTMIASAEGMESAYQELVQLEQEGGSTWVSSMLGRLSAQMGKWREAIEAYERALNKDPSNWEAQPIMNSSEENAEIGAKAFWSGKIRKALWYLNAAIAKTDHSEIPWAIFDSGKCMEGLGNYAEALNRLLESKKYLGDNTWVNSRLGIVYEKMGRIEEATQCYQDALMADPGNHEALDGLHRL